MSAQQYEDRRHVPGGAEAAAGHWRVVHGQYTNFVLKMKKKRKDHAFWRQFIEKPRGIPGCPGSLLLHPKR